MKHIKLIFITLILFSLFLGGCSSSEANKDAESSITINWKKDGFLWEDTISETEIDSLNNPPFSETGYDSVSEPDFTSPKLAVCTDYLDDIIYKLFTVKTENENQLILYTYQVSADKKTEKNSFILTLPETLPDGYGLCIDVVSSQQQNILYAESIGNGTAVEKLWMLQVDFEGKITNAIALDNSYLEQENTSDIEKTIVPSLFMVDNTGCSYLVNYISKVLYIFDDKGALLNRQDYSQTDGDQITGAFRTTDGSVILQKYSMANSATELIWYETPIQKEHVLTVLENSVYQIEMVKEDIFYVINGSRLTKWNAVDGKKEILFNFIQSDISFASVTDIGISSNGEIILYIRAGGKDNAYFLSDKQQELDESAIRIASMTKIVDSYIKSCSKSVTRLYPDVVVNFETSAGDLEAYKTRINAELVSDNGPDLMWVSVEDMQILQKQGALLDLEEIISEDTLSYIFPGVIESGKIDGKLVGIYFDAYPVSYLVANSLWTENTWTLQDIVDIASNNPNLESLVCTSYGSYSMNTILSILALKDLEHSPLIDFDTNTSHFNSELFIELLTLIKKYGDSPEYSKEELATLLQEGKVLAIYGNYFDVQNLPYYSETMAIYEDHAHLIGIPNGLEYQGFWGQSFFLVVNKNTEKKEQVEQFLKYLLRSDILKTVTMGNVRRNSVQSSVFFEDYTGEYKYKVGENTYRTLELKENGSTYLDDYIAFLDKCGPLPRSYDAIEGIVSAEAESYFYGNRTAEETAKIIHNRVQLYLDEQY